MTKISSWRSSDNDNVSQAASAHNYTIKFHIKKKRTIKNENVKENTDVIAEQPQSPDVPPHFETAGVLYRYANAGWLDMGDKRYSTEDRVRVAERLYKDFRLSQFSDCKAVVIGSIKPEICGDFTLLDNVLDARTRYQQAMLSIPHEFWPSVRKVCIENQELFDNDNGESKRQQAYRTYAAKVDLCRGLDRLIEHYLRRKKEKNKAV